MSKNVPFFHLNVNKPPLANAGPDIIVKLPNRAAALDGSKSFDDYGIVRYTWTRDLKSPAAGVRWFYFTLNRSFGVYWHHYVGVLSWVWLCRMFSIYNRLSVDGSCMFVFLFFSLWLTSNVYLSLPGCYKQKWSSACLKIIKSCRRCLQISTDSERCERNGNVRRCSYHCKTRFAVAKYLTF